MPRLCDELASGDKGRTLRAIRRLLAERIADNPRPRDLATLSYRLMAVMKEVDELDAGGPRTSRRARFNRKDI